jgi:hypothetical protein
MVADDTCVSRRGTSQALLKAIRDNAKGAMYTAKRRKDAQRLVQKALIHSFQRQKLSISRLCVTYWSGLSIHIHDGVTKA